MLLSRRHGRRLTAVTSSGTFAVCIRCMRFCETTNVANPRLKGRPQLLKIALLLTRRISFYCKCGENAKVRGDFGRTKCKGEREPFWKVSLRRLNCTPFFELIL
uniref:Secreted protein n=1 Tax=Trichuris muris TaxID=70415 RepID=A0A5S6QWP3_TRIMR